MLCVNTRPHCASCPCVRVCVPKHC